MSKTVFEITGFKELNRKIKQLPYKLKKREMLKVLRIVAKPTVAAARSQAPVGVKAHKRYSKKDGAVLGRYLPGNLKKSIGNITGKRGLGRNNAVIYVGARSKGKKYDGYYAGMVHGGTKYQSANPFMDRAYNQTKGLVTADAEINIAKLIQRQIDKLSIK